MRWRGSLSDRVLKHIGLPQKGAYVWKPEASDD